MFDEPKKNKHPLPYVTIQQTPGVLISITYTVLFFLGANRIYRANWTDCKGYPQYMQRMYAKQQSKNLYNMQR